MKNILLGTHLPYLKETQLLGVIEMSIKIGTNSGGFYISKSRGYGKYELNKDMLEKAHKLAKENNINIKDFIVHSPLIGNMANKDKEKDIYKKTINSYLADLITMEESGIKYFNFHPGSWEDREAGIKQIAKGINYLHKKTKGHNTVLLLETMMGKGNYIGRNFEDLKEIIDLVEDKKRIGVCMDTCHVWDGGYDIKNNLDGVLKEFDKVIGIKYLKGVHINDSMNDINTHKDRHANIGKGFIGQKALNNFVNHPLIVNLPKVVETPHQGKGDLKLLRKELDKLI